MTGACMNNIVEHWTSLTHLMLLCSQNCATMTHNLVPMETKVIICDAYITYHSTIIFECCLQCNFLSKIALLVFSIYKFDSISLNNFCHIKSNNYILALKPNTSIWVSNLWNLIIYMIGIGLIFFHIFSDFGHNFVIFLAISKCCSLISASM